TATKQSPQGEGKGGHLSRLSARRQIHERATCPLFNPGECKATVSQVSTVGGLPTVPSWGVQS
ncbi:hypothetical protein NDU88_006222, partial [Pleurodeles waltl]